jgi:hypothetical protein
MTQVNHQQPDNHQKVSFKQKLESSYGYFENLTLAKKRLSYYRWKVVEELDKSLIEFESNVKRTGGTVWWANVPEDAHQYISPFTESNVRVSFLQSKIIQELQLSMKFEIPVISRFLQDNNRQFPDCIILEPKFLVVSSGHIYYCTNNQVELEALHQAKKVIFVAGIDTLVLNGYELELAKNLYSLYETGEFGFPFETLIKPGKPENRHAQQVHLILLDNGRSNLLENPAIRHWFYLLNFIPDKAIETGFFGETDEPGSRFHERVLNPIKEYKPKALKQMFDSIGYARLSEYLPYQMNLLCDLLNIKSELNKSKSAGILSKFLGNNDLKLFLTYDKFIQGSKFISFMNERYFKGNMNITSFPARNFIEQYFYNKRKI